MPSLNTKLASAPNTTSNYVLKATSSTTIGNSLIYSTGVYTSIGTTATHGNLTIEQTTGESGLVVNSSIAQSPTLYLRDAGSVGYSTIVTNNKLYINSSAVGIGTSDPLWKLDVRGAIGALNSGGDGTLGDCIYFGSAGYPTTQNNRVRSSTSASGPSNYLVFETSNGTIGSYNTNQLVLRGNGNIGVGTTSPTAKLEIREAPAGDWGISVTANTTTSQSYGGIVRGGTNSNDVAFRVNNAANNSNYFTVRGDGAIFFLGSYPFTTGSGSNMWIDTSGVIQRNVSSIKYKKDVQDYHKGLEDLLKLRPVSYLSKSEIDNPKRYAGMIAEELHELGFSEYVNLDENGEPDSISYASMVALLTKAIQEQQAMIEAQQQQINQLINK